MRMRRHHYQQDEDTGIDLTPMLDVVFIMLIFFIVTSSFVKESGVEVQRPQADTASAQDKGAAADKSQYTLFNPTPKEQMRPFNTDRPTKSNVPYTVDAGHFQIETDLEFSFKLAVKFTP